MADIERLERKVDELTDMVKTMSSIVKDIYQVLSIPNKLTEEKIAKDNKPQLYDKEEVNWKGLIEATKDTNSEKFVLSIYNNEYKTITKKQLDALDDIATQYEVDFNK